MPNHNSPLTYLKMAVAALLDLPIDHSEVLAIAVAYQDGIRDMQDVVADKFGSVEFEISEGWISGTRIQKSRKTDPANRKRSFHESGDA